jgi:glycosyltransferase involved in cell wall biosynthesis
MSGRIPVLYLAPWVGYGGSDKNTIDWFRWIDRDRFAPHLITTQASDNPLLGAVTPYAEEVWVLPDLMAAEQMPAFIFDFLESRGIEVIHLMNSRLGFDLMPDLFCLSAPPAVVVQLHVEEVDRSGYVRYVTTRFGNLVDRFSISNQHVADAVHGYGVPQDKIEVIYTGVDAEEEFSPQAATAVEQFDGDDLEVLFAVRLTDQKDPLLMLDVAAELRDRGAPVRFRVVGDGDMEQVVRDRIAELDLGDRVTMHPPTAGLAGWYAACDVLLLTSKFEGVPVAVFEAMAMGMPIVAPALPAIGELLDQEEDDLIVDGDASAYADALARLAADPAGRERRGAAMRERAQRRFSVQEMASKHGAMYERLLADRPRPAREESPRLPEPLRFLDRAALDQPLVSVVIPHYNQGHFLRECVESVRAQSYDNVEIVIVDDASDQSGTAEALDAIEASGGVEVIRLEENGGPSRARNAAVERCGGRYVLPVDADNLLLPDAIERLVAQLGTAGEDVGFIYPNLDFFGNREEYHEAPPYNLYTLLHANFCDTCSLIDSAVFAAGMRYHGDIKLGHEDWEFALQMAAGGVRGEPAHGPTVRYRKWGFNRSDLVDHAYSDFRETFLAEVSPLGAFQAEIKGAESPALSVVDLRPVAEASVLAEALAGQTCADVEVVAGFTDDAIPAGAPRTLRRFPPGEPAETLERAFGTARGPFVAVTTGGSAALLADPAFVEKVLRRFDGDGELDAIAIADGGAEGRFDLATLPGGDDSPVPDPHTIVVRRGVETELPFGLLAEPGAPVPSIARLLCGAGRKVEWRHLRAPDAVSGSPAATDPAAWVAVPPDPARRQDPHGLNPPAQPLLPGRDAYEVPRWAKTPTWIAPLSTVLIRYKARIGERRLVVPGEPSDAYDLDHFLGSLRSTGVPGTKKLIAIDGTFRALAREEWRAVPAGAIELGYLEEAPLPGLEALALAVHRTTGQHVLVGTGSDALLSSVDVIGHLGFVDPFPLRPRGTPRAERSPGLRSLTKTADPVARRHRYAIDGFAAGEQIGELGAIAESGLQGNIPLWVADGYVVTSRYRPPMRRPAAVGMVRWSAEPVAWSDIGTPSARLRVMLRRATQSAQSRSRPAEPPAVPDGEPHGWLFENPLPGMSALHASHHPITGDQLLTREAQDAVEMGYEDTQLLGFIADAAPLTGSLAQRAIAISWARRSGHVPQGGR